MSDFSPAVITAGNLGAFVDVLKGPEGAAVDLTGATVVFVAQGMPGGGTGPTSFSGAATITDAVNGKVSYTVAAGQTDVPGSYHAQWVVTIGGNAVAYPFPGGTNGFEIQERLPVTAAAQTTLISDLYELVRAILGDFDPDFRRYEDDAIASVVRCLVRTGRLKSNIPYAVTNDRRGISPALAGATDLALLVYHSARMFLMPESASYAFRTRALAEKFGEQRMFVQDLQNIIYDMENAQAVWSFQSFYGWVNGITGLNIWCVMTDMNVNAPVATVTVSRSGIMVTRS